jgi:hypothetical protein
MTLVSQATGRGHTVTQHSEGFILSGISRRVEPQRESIRRDHESPKCRKHEEENRR